MVIRRSKTGKISKNNDQQQVDSSSLPMTTATSDESNDDDDVYLRACSSVQLTTELGKEEEKIRGSDDKEEVKENSGDTLQIGMDVDGDLQIDGDDESEGGKKEMSHVAEEEKDPVAEKEVCEVRDESTIAQVALRINDEMIVKRHLEKGPIKRKMALRDESLSNDDVDAEIVEGATPARVNDSKPTKYVKVRIRGGKQKTKETFPLPMEAPEDEDPISRETRSDKRQISTVELEQPNSDSEYNDEDETELYLGLEDQSCTKRRGRGSTTLPHITKTKTRVRKVVEYNEHGQPIGKFASELASYMGVLARQMVPVSHEKWKSVPCDLKEDLWRALEAKYVLEKGSKKLLVNGIGDKWRSFKSTLTRRYVLPFKDEPDHLAHPPACYRFIKQECWEEFVKSRLNDDFQALHKAQSERRAKAKFPHRLGRTGYAGLIEKMRKDEGIPLDQLDRCLLWKKARQNKNGEYDDDLTREQVEIIDELKKQVEEGVLVCDGNMDVLTLALGTPEKSGRVRGAGRVISQSAFFHKSLQQSSKATDKLDEEQPVLAENKWEEERASRLRAEGQLLNTQGMVSRLEETLAHFMENEKSSTSAAKRASLRKNGTPLTGLNNDNEDENLTIVPIRPPSPKTRLVRTFYNQASQRLTSRVPYILVQVDALVFGAEMELYLDLDDVGYVCHMEDLSANCVMVYMRHLYDILTSRGQHVKYEFINPVSISSANDDDVSTILTTRLQNTNCEWIFLPYNPEGTNWLLIVINMVTMSCYWLDPSGLPSRYNIKPFVTVGLKGLQKDGLRRPSPIWYNVKCPKQKTNSESGFYIMKYMREIIDEASNMFTRKEPFHRSTYEQNDIDAVRLEWIQIVEKHM